jgi:hypothetical protein
MVQGTTDAAQQTSTHRRKGRRDPGDGAVFSEPMACRCYRPRALIDNLTVRETGQQGLRTRGYRISR